MRSLTLLGVRLLAAVCLLAGCQLLTGGQGSTDEPADASTSPASACNLACVQGSHCEVQSQGPVCVPSDVPVATPTVDAAVVPPAAVCSLACSAGSHCAVQPQGPACVPDVTMVIVDAGPPVPVACNLLCAAGRHCKVTATGPSCVLDKPVVIIDASLPLETPCGDTTCAADEKCCSASCGICEPKGGLCPAIACELDASVPKETCAAALCPSGTFCDDSTGTVACKPLPSCAAALCPSGTYCDDITGTVECKPLPSCDTVKCTAGTTCELVQVQCIRAPCPPLPQCVTKGPQVCNLACKGGTHCVVTNSGPLCEPDPGGVSCGKKTCSGGQICCSASCGICGSAGGACPAIACAPLATD